MSKMPNQKLKLLHLVKILEEQTDELHTMTVPQLIDALAAVGIMAERKSIYDDLEALRRFGLDIVTVRGRTTGHYLASRTFELAELKLLVDSVQSSKFITVKKSMELIGKLESLTSRHEARQLRRQVYVLGRIKTMNESIYYNIDEIHTGISQNRKISFKYFEYTVAKERRFRRNGARYLVSPMALTRDDENYYLLAFDSETGILKHYRVDKMVDIAVTEQPREGQEVFAGIDMAAYTSRIFSMYGGEEETVRLRFGNELIGVVIDRFGKDVLIVQSDEKGFTVQVRVFVSPQFFGWLCSFGGKAAVVSPEHVAKAYKGHVQAVLEACFPDPKA